MSPWANKGNVVHICPNTSRFQLEVSTSGWIGSLKPELPKEKALDWLDKAYEEQDVVCGYLKTDPVYDDIRSHPRFQKLLQKLKLD